LVQLKSRQLGGMLMVVYVQEALLPRIADVRTEAQGTGILGVMV
jgi:hypothetical protein